MEEDDLSPQGRRRHRPSTGSGDPPVSNNVTDGDYKRVRRSNHTKAAEGCVVPTSHENHIGNIDTCLAGLKQKWVGRSREIDQLATFLTSHVGLDDGPPSSMLVLGPAASGRTNLVLDVLHNLELDYAYASPSQCNGISKNLFGLLAGQLTAHVRKSSLSDDKSIHRAMKQCRTAGELELLVLSSLAPSRRKPFVFVIDDADEPDLLASVSAVAWSTLQKLQERTRRNLRVIFIATSDDARLEGNNTLFFEPYSDEALKRIISQQFAHHVERVTEGVPEKDQVNKEFRQFLRFALARFATVGTELDDHTYMTSYLWRGKLETLQAFNAAVTPRSKNMVAAIEHLNQRLLERDCQPLSGLVTSLESFDRPSEMASDQQLQAFWTTAEVAKRLATLRDRQIVNAAELPFFAKVLLLSFYMASYNPVDYDAALFGGKKRRRKAKGHSQQGSRLTVAGDDVAFVGPKVFSMERGRWLFRALLTDLSGSIEAEKASYGVHRYLESLSSLRLVARCSEQTDLNDVRFKCLASRSFCEAVARNLGLDLNKYLAENAVL